MKENSVSFSKELGIWPLIPFGGHPDSCSPQGNIKHAAARLTANLVLYMGVLHGQAEYVLFALLMETGCISIFHSPSYCK